jgi:hypothetical protein
LEANRPEGLVEVDWPLVSTKSSKDNQSISSAIDTLSYSRSFSRKATSHGRLDFSESRNNFFNFFLKKLQLKTSTISCSSLLVSSKSRIGLDW